MQIVHFLSSFILNVTELCILQHVPQIGVEVRAVQITLKTVQTIIKSTQHVLT